MAASGVAIPQKRKAGIGFWLFLAVTSFLLLFQQGNVVGNDGASMLAVAHSFVHHGTFSLAKNAGVLGRHGHYFSKHPVGMSILAVPAVALASILGSLFGHGPSIEGFLASSLIPMINGLLAVAIYRLSRRLGGSVGWSVAVGAGSVLANYSLAYGKDFFAEPLTALGITFAIEQLISRRRLWAGLGLAVAFLARPQTGAIMIAFTIVWLLVDDGAGGIWARVKGSVPLIAPQVVVGVVVAAYDLVRFGSPFDVGYRNVGFNANLWPGISGFLFSSDKSVIIFCPLVVILPFALREVFRRSRLAFWLVMSNLVVTFLLASSWQVWNGGWTWGPRLLLPGVLPALATLGVLGTIAMRRAAVALMIVGAAISASTLLVPTQTQQLDNPVPKNPGILRQFRLLPSVTRYTAHHLFSGHTNVPGSHRRFLALWQVGFSRELGRPGLVLGILGSIVLVGILVWSLRALWRGLRADAPAARGLGPVRPVKHEHAGANA